ncbi:MAG: hypothetical protein IT522_13615 [Burkholderiales bacterium]|nr:hypothetical protein [Burkholderiales bacterium]
MKLPRIALSIRAQLLLVLTVFLALPWLGVNYVRELERVLRDAHERTLAGTAQAVATALHDRPRLFATPPDPIASFARERSADASDAERALPPSASPEIAQIIEGLSRTTARIWVIDRQGTVLARAGTLKPAPARAPAASVWEQVEQATLGRLYRAILEQPREDFVDDAATQGAPHGRDVEGALAGILTTERRRTADGRAVIVSAAHPIWVGDEVRGAVIVEETGNAVLAERNRAFERLFNIVLAVLLVGSFALTAYATLLSARIRRLRDDAERAIDADGRVRAPLASSRAGDEIGDLSRSFAAVLARLAGYARHQEKMASRLSHELRTPIAVVRSSLDNLKATPMPEVARVYMERAQEGLARLTQILTRMAEAARLEESLSDVERERFDLVPVVRGCVEGYRLAYPGARIGFAAEPAQIAIDGSPDLIAQMLDKLVANAVEFAQGGAIDVTVRRHDAAVELAVTNEGPPLPEGMEGRLFESMVSVRAGGDAAEPHLGLGLYIVQVIAQFHRGRVRAANRSDGRGVAVMVTLPPAEAPPW